MRKRIVKWGKTNGKKEIHFNGIKIRESTCSSNAWMFLPKRRHYYHLSTHEVYYLLNFSSYYTETGSPHI